MMAKTKRLLNIIVVSAVLLCMTGCSIDGTAIRKEEITRKDLIDSVSLMIEGQKGVISQYLEFEDVDYTSLPGKDIATKALGEEDGQQYLEFCYEINRSATPEEVLERARGLLSEEKFEELKAQADEIEEKIETGQVAYAKSLPAEQREAFTKDLKKLLVKTIVLLTAGIVYACMPDVMLWGKIGAAAGISVAAGATAVTVMSIYEHYQFGHEGEESFKTWIEQVITLPKAEYAIATSIISIGETFKMGPVVSGIVLCVFAIYKAVDMLRPMLQIYNFDI
jgi:hypothetical protein